MIDLTHSDDEEEKSATSRKSNNQMKRKRQAEVIIVDDENSNVVWENVDEHVAKEFTIDGRPRSQKQRGFNGIKFFNPSRKEQKNLRLQCMKFAPLTPWSCPVKMEIIFTFKPSKNNQSLTGHYYPKKPDIDNLQKLVNDALSGLFFKDDSQIVDVHATKVYGEREGTYVKISQK